MKKLPVFLCAAMLLGSAAHAEDDITVFVNDTELSFDQPPIIYNDRTLVPMRAIFESLGLTVQWFGEEQRITAFDDDINVTMFIINSLKVVCDMMRRKLMLNGEIY